MAHLPKRQLPPHSTVSGLRISLHASSSGALQFNSSHLAYCTNIHPAETWAATRTMLQHHVLAVRDQLRLQGSLGSQAPFAIGLRLSAIAAEELLQGSQLEAFRDWLEETNTYVFTINGFPYGSFHGTRVKEQVFRPDWTDPARIHYTKNLFQILAGIARPDTGASVSTLPGSHKSFRADDEEIRRQLADFALWLDALADETGHDFHLGLEPEPIGHFENTVETLGFFERLHARSPHGDAIRRRIGLNYDTCHFAIEFDDTQASLDTLRQAGIRISKIHLSSALALDPTDPAAIDAIRSFDEPTYFHQVIARRDDGSLQRFTDLPDFLAAVPLGLREARVHFHIPLDAEPEPPLRSTRNEVLQVLDWRRRHPEACTHFEIETYTWGVLPGELRRPVESQIAGEYAWVLGNR